VPRREVRHSFLEILRALNKARVRYLVVGGVAVVFHGVDRTTHDLDIFPHLSRGNLLKAVRALGRLGFKPVLPVPAESIADRRVRDRWIRERHMKVFSFLDPRDPLHPVDLMVLERVPFESSWPRRNTILVRRVSIPLMSIPDLITMKRKAGRDRDRSDIESLRNLQREKGRQG